MARQQTVAMIALLAGASCATAFSPVLSANRHVELRPRQAVCSLSPSRFGGLLARNQKPLVVMQSSKENPAAKEIDFGKVDFSDGSESGFSGMVFRPEDSEEPESRCRVDWDVKCEKALNDHINVEFTASYAYHALFAYFDRDTVALNGFAHYFKKQSDEERDHAESFIKYQNRRGGKVVLKPVAVPEMQFTRVDGTSDALYAMELALQLEKFVYRKLKQLHSIGSEAQDPQFCDEIETYLGEQVEAVKKVSEYVAQIKRVGTGHGVWDLDRQLLEA